MASAWIRFRHRLELAGVRLLVALPRLFPVKISVALMGSLGVFFFDVVRMRRRVTLENLERAFGSTLDARERVRIGRRSYVNFAKSMAEFAALGRFRSADYRRLVGFEGLEHFEAPLARGEGIVAVTGHLGSWELLGAAVADRGFPVDFLVGEQSNSLVNGMMNDLRRAGGIGIIERGVAARGVFEALRKGRVVALLADQDARRAGIFVDFFGRPASTFQGPAQFSYRTGSPIVCCAIARRADDTHEVTFSEPIYPRRDAPREEEIVRLTRAHAAVLEEYVRRHPGDYFWAHRRWKTAPPAASPGGGPPAGATASPASSPGSSGSRSAGRPGGSPSA